MRHFNKFDASFHMRIKKWNESDHTIRGGREGGGQVVFCQNGSRMSDTRFIHFWKLKTVEHGISCEMDGYVSHVTFWRRVIDPWDLVTILCNFVEEKGGFLRTMLFNTQNGTP